MKPSGNWSIEANQLAKRYGDITAVDHLDLRVWRGEVYGFLGPNRSGKTTTLRMLAGWPILAIWAAVGVLLVVATRGTSLAISVGLLYSLVIEGLISAFANQISWLEPIVDLFLRTDVYSLVRSIGSLGGAEANGPGAFSGPFVSGAQALAVLIGYVVIFLGLSGWLLQRRGVV